MKVYKNKVKYPSQKSKLTRSNDTSKYIQFNILKHCKYTLLLKKHSSHSYKLKSNINICYHYNKKHYHINCTWQNIPGEIKNNLTPIKENSSVSHHGRLRSFARKAQEEQPCITNLAAALSWQQPCDSGPVMSREHPPTWSVPLSLSLSFPHARLLARPIRSQRSLPADLLAEGGGRQEVGKAQPPV